jgi:hypothetical protein
VEPFDRSKRPIWPGGLKLPNLNINELPYPVTIDLPALTDLRDKYRGDSVARRLG